MVDPPRTFAEYTELRNAGKVETRIAEIQPDGTMILVLYDKRRTEAEGQVYSIRIDDGKHLPTRTGQAL